MDHPFNDSSHVAENGRLYCQDRQLAESSVKYGWPALSTYVFLFWPAAAL